MLPRQNIGHYTVRVNGQKPLRLKNPDSLVIPMPVTVLEEGGMEVPVEATAPPGKSAIIVAKLATYHELAGHRAEDLKDRNRVQIGVIALVERTKETISLGWMIPEFVIRPDLVNLENVFCRMAQR